MKKQLRSNKKEKFFGAFIAIVIIAVGIGMAYAMNSGIDKIPIKKFFSQTDTNAVWDWSNITKHDAADLNETSNYLYMHQINTVYVDISSYSDISSMSDQEERAKQMKQLEDSIDKYVRAMKKRNIKVLAAAGNTDWSKPENQHIPLAIQQFVYNYNNTRQNKLDGTEFDIEAYNQSGFAEASFTEKELVLNEFLDTVDKLATAHQKYVNESGSNEFELGFAIPYWFDNENQNIKSVTWKDKTGPTLFHILDRLNQVNASNIVVMAYRNAALGNDGMVYHSRTEMDYAKSKAPNVKVLMGIEVNNVEPAKITFYGQNQTELSSEVSKLYVEFSDNDSFKGTAINDLQGYRTMQDSNR